MKPASLMARLLILAALPIVFANDLRADTATNLEIAKTYTLFYLRHGDWAKSKAYLEQYLAQDGSSAEAWNLQGLTGLYEASYAKGLEAEKQRAEGFALAIQSFKTAGERAGTDNASAYQYNLADTYARMGQPEAAKKILVPLAEHSSVSDSASRALELLENADTKKKSPLPPVVVEKDGKWSLSGNFKTAYDSNVLLIPDASVSAVSNSKTASAVLSPGLAATFSKVSSSHRFEFEADSSFDFHTTEATRSYNTLDTNFAAAWIQDPAQNRKLGHSYGVTGGVQFLNTDGLAFYNYSAIPYYSWNYEPDAASLVEITLPVGFQKFHSLSDTDPFDRTGLTWRPSLLVRKSYGSYSGNLGLSFQWDMAKGTEYRMLRVGLPVGFTKNDLFWNMAFSSQLQFFYARFPSSSAKRKDGGALLSTALFRRFGNQTVSSLNYELDINRSSDLRYHFTQHVIAIQVSYELL